MSNVPWEPGAGGERDGPDEFWLSRRWWRRAGQTSVAAYGSTLLAFVGTLVAARELGPDGLGAVVLAVSTATVIATLLDLSLEDAVVFHGYRALKAGRLHTLRSLIRRSLVLDVTIGVGVSVFVIALAGPLADLVSGGRMSADLLRLATLVVLASTIDGTTGGMLLVARRPDLRAWVMALTNTLRLGGVLVAVQLGGAEAVVIAYATAATFGAAFQAFLAWRIGWRHWRRGGSPDEEPVGSRTLISFAFHTSLAATLFSGRDMLIPILLGSMAGPAAVGLFRVAMLPVTAVAVAGSPIKMLLLPEQARLAANARFDALWRSIRVHTLAGLAIGIPCAVGGWFALEWLIPLLYSDSFAGAVEASRILLIAAVAHLAGSWWKTLPAALGMPALRTFVAAISFALMMGLLALLADRGSEGAAWSFSLASAITGIAWFVLARILLRRAEVRNGAAGSQEPRPPEGAVARS